MAVISYAQNREDVLLARVFPGPAGFYIDVGAAHPVVHSVTKWFYERGWTGINIEPVTQFFDLITDDRTRDINLKAVASDEPGLIDLYEVADSIGMSTVDRDLANDLSSNHGPAVSHSVRAVTLAEICAEYVGNREIDFLKIDAEGHEPAVLRGADFSRWRPRVLVIEATEAGSPTLNHSGWEPLVMESDYLYATFDGLNRYYVRAEDRDLVAVFEPPVSVFDDYRLAELVQTQRDLDSLATKLDTVQAELTRTRSAYDLSTRILNLTRTQLESVRTAVLRQPA